MRHFHGFWIPLAYVAVCFLGMPVANGEMLGACSDEGVSEARALFNQAIADDDFDTIEEVLADDVVLVTGTDSDIYMGKNSQLNIWRSDVDLEDRLLYVRNLTGSLVSPSHPLALEWGEWTGTADDGALVGGDYTAKWRCVNNRWSLEAEIFMTTRCSERLCD